MNNQILKLIAVLLFTNACLLALTPEERQFIKRYSLPLAAEKILNSKYSEVKPLEQYDLNEYGVFFAKRFLERINGAEYIKDFIQKAGIKHIKVADKYVYHIPGQHETLRDKNYLVLAKKVYLLPLITVPLSLETIEELAAIIRFTHFTDIKPNLVTGNLIMTGEDELTIIDTGCDGFLKDDVDNSYVVGT